MSNNNSTKKFKPLNKILKYNLYYLKKKTCIYKRIVNRSHHLWKSEHRFHAWQGLSLPYRQYAWMKRCLGGLSGLLRGKFISRVSQAYLHWLFRQILQIILIAPISLRSLLSRRYFDIDVFFKFVQTHYLYDHVLPKLIFIWIKSIFPVH